MTYRRPLWVLAAFAAPLLSCSESPTTQDQSATSVLFIGNSLTYANDLPGTTAGIAASTGFAISVGDASRGGVALIDYFHDSGAALRAIDEGAWDFVVLQQGPTWPGLCRDTLVLATTMLADRIRARGGTPALMMPWAALNDMQYLDGVRAAYREAATAAGALFLPVGDAWKIALDDDPTLPLYDSDDYHPAPLGTYLAALVVYEKLTGGDARQLPVAVIVDGVQLDVSEHRIRLLQDAAHAANIGAGSPGGRGARVNAAVTC
jgi:hypothetical protein